MRRLIAALALVGAGAFAAPGVAGAAPPQWVPSDPQPDLSIDACGGTIRVSDGDVYEAEERVRTRRDGTVIVDFRGDVTTDVYFDPDGEGPAPEVQIADELDNGGRARLVIRPDGSQTLTVHGPGIIYPVNDVERAAYLELTGSPAFYVARGTYIESYDAEGNFSIDRVPPKRFIVPACEAVGVSEAQAA